MIYPGWVAAGITSRALTAAGCPKGLVSKHEKNAMSVEACARRIVPAIARRKREVVMTVPGKLGLWLKLALPRLVDKVSLKECG